MSHTGANLRFALMICALAVTPRAASAKDCAAEPLVKNAAMAFQNAARSGSPDAFSSAIGHYADIRGLALFALGSYRSKLAPTDTARYVMLARNYMGSFMAQYSSHISGGSLSIVNCSAVSVTARFEGGTNLVFRLRGEHISDVAVSGFSVAQAMRDKFMGVISSHGGDVNALIDLLSQ